MMENKDKNNIKKIQENLSTIPEAIFTSTPEDDYILEMELLDRYLSFSAEILRLSLLGIAVVGYIYTKIIIPDGKIVIDFTTKLFFILGISCFAISSLSSVIFRYIATDAFRYFGYYIRLNKHEDIPPNLLKIAQEKRHNRLKYGPVLKGISAFLLVLGAVFVAMAFIKIILYPC